MNFKKNERIVYKRATSQVDNTKRYSSYGYQRRYCHYYDFYY
jgi:hypothetical protein